MIPKTWRGVVLWLVVVVFACAAVAQTATDTGVPPLVKFSGTLANTQGTVGVIFALYTDQTGGAPLWLETQNVTPDANGRYTVYLGVNHANGVPLDIFASAEAHWLGVQPEGQAEQPRVQLVSVPYALKAADATTLGGQPLSAFVLASNAGTTTGIGSGTVTVNAGSGVLALASPQVGLSPVNTSGSALPNYMAKFSTATDIEPSTVIYDSGSAVGIGTTAPAAILHVVSPTAVAGMIDAYSGASSTSLGALPMVSRAARGTAGSPSAVKTNDYLGGLGARAYTGTTFTGGWRAAVLLRADQDWTDTAQGTNIAFGVTAPNTVAQKQVMWLTSGGALGIGINTPSALLEVNGTAKFDGLVTFAAGQIFPGASVSITSSDSSVAVGGTAGAPTVALNTSFTNALYAPVSGSTSYAPASGSASYVGKAGDTMTGSLTLPAIVGPANSALGVSASAAQALNLSTPNLGSGSGNGGSINITAGQAGSGSGGSGGSVNLTAGYNMPSGGSGYGNLGAAGNVNITGGGGYNSAGGNVIVTSGSTSPWGSGNTFSKVSLVGGMGNTGDGGVLDVEGGHTVSYPNTNGGSIKLTAGNAVGGSIGGNIVFQPGTGSTSGSVQVLGKLGVGNSNPGYSLDVSGAANATQYCISGANCITAWPSGGGVSSFNSRTGTVMPASGDYSFSQINGTATDSQIAGLSASKLTGAVAVANGGTGITTLPAAGQYLRGTVTGWAPSAIQASDVPSLSNNYVDLTSTQTSIGGSKTFIAPVTFNATGTALTASGSSYGVNSFSNGGIALYGLSNSGTAVSGYSYTGYGVSGVGNTGVYANGGVYGVNASGNTGVYGKGGVVGVYGTVSSGNAIAGLFDNPFGGKILSGQNNGTEYFSVDASGDVTANGGVIAGGNVITTGNVMTAGAVLTAVPNSSSGTTNAYLVKLTGGLAVQAGTSDSTGILGVVGWGGGTTGNAQIAVAGQASCIFDGATMAGDYVQPSSSTAGACHDNGATYPSTGQVLGRVLSTNGNAGNYGVYLFGAEQRAAGSGSLAGDVTGTSSATSVVSTHLSAPLPIAQGGTAATAALNARTNLGAAAKGANTDITSLGGLTTPLSIGQGGTAATTAAGARVNLGAAASGANADITSLSGLTTPLTLVANGLQMAGNQIVTNNGRFLYGTASNSGNISALFDIGGTMTAPTYSASLLQLDGTVGSSAYGQAYLKGLVVAPTFNLYGYGNYLMGIDLSMASVTGTAGVHSVVGYHLGAQPTNGLECNVGFGISVPNQNTALCNGKYGFYQGDATAQYNYFASKVGIGTPFPSQALTVQGNAQVTGNVQITGNLSVTGSSSPLTLASGGGEPVDITGATGVVISSAYSGSGINGGDVTVFAGGGNTGWDNANGGNLNLSSGGGGNGGAPGNVNITGGPGYNAVGGNVIITSGTTSPWVSSPVFSQISLQGGVENTGDGASLSVEGGHANGSYNSPAPSGGGNVAIKGGSAQAGGTSGSSTPGGNVTVTAGNSIGSSAGGNIVLTPGTGSPNGIVQVMGNLVISGTGAMPVYNNSGAAQNSAHMVVGTASISGVGSVSLASSVAFTSPATYACVASVALATPGLTASAQNVSGSQFSIYTNVGAAVNVNYICVGN